MPIIKTGPIGRSIRVAGKNVDTWIVDDVIQENNYVILEGFDADSRGIALSSSVNLVPYCRTGPPLIFQCFSIIC